MELKPRFLAAVLAAVLALAACSESGARPAEPGASLEREPRGLPADAGHVLDLCDDNDAIAAGLNGGDLDTDRRRAGIDCEGNGGNRFASVQADGGLVLGADDRFVESVRAAEHPVGLTFSGDLSRPIGRSAPVTEAPAEVADDLVVLADTVNRVDKSTYGMLFNGTDQVARNVTVRASGVTYVHPLSVQPGELVPFELFGVTVSGADIKVDAMLSAGVDLTRLFSPDGLSSISTSASPEQQAELGLPGVTLAALEGHTLDVVLFSMVEAVNSQGRSFTARGRAGFEPVVVVALYDQDGRVVEVSQLDVYTPSDDRQQAGWHEVDVVDHSTQVSVFVLVPENHSYELWSGGR